MRCIIRHGRDLRTSLEFSDLREKITRDSAESAAWHLWKSILEKTDRVYTEEEKVKLAEKKNDYYKELLQKLDDGAVLKGAKETLAKLREMGVLIGVGSVSKNTPMILEKTGLLPYIDKVSCGLDITKSKPDPEVFLVAAKKLGLPAEECLVVEDAAAGIQAAKAAGMKSLAVGPYYEKLGATYQAPGLYAVNDWKEMLG